jgi:TetR/AcrR family transcriptional repressor of mexJK operon
MMEIHEQGRSARKRGAIREAATSLFLSKGYLETSMDEVAALAAVSKQTVYKNFADKERLFSEIVLATTDQIDEMVRLVSATLNETDDVEKDLHELAGQFITTIMRPEMLRLRRLIIANAERFPKLGRTWYEQGFERVFATVADRFQRLADQGILRLDDPLLAANHFFGLLLWTPVNRAMFTGDNEEQTEADLERATAAAVRVFLAAYGAPDS